MARQTYLQLLKKNCWFNVPNLFFADTIQPVWFQIGIENGRGIYVNKSFREWFDLFLFS